MTKVYPRRDKNTERILDHITKHARYIDGKLTIEWGGVKVRAKDSHELRRYIEDNISADKLV